MSDPTRYQLKVESYFSHSENELPLLHRDVIRSHLQIPDHLEAVYMSPDDPGAPAWASEMLADYAERDTIPIRHPGCTSALRLGHLISGEPYLVTVAENEPHPPILILAARDVTAFQLDFVATRAPQAVLMPDFAERVTHLERKWGVTPRSEEDLR